MPACTKFLSDSTRATERARPALLLVFNMTKGKELEEAQADPQRWEFGAPIEGDQPERQGVIDQHDPQGLLRSKFSVVRAIQIPEAPRATASAMQKARFNEPLERLRKLVSSMLAEQYAMRQNNGATQITNAIRLRMYHGVAQSLTVKRKIQLPPKDMQPHHYELKHASLSTHVLRALEEGDTGRTLLCATDVKGRLQIARDCGWCHAMKKGQQIAA